jgi:hypothetical protein
MLEKGKTPFRTVWRHRRVRLEDILNYRKNLFDKRREVLDELAAQAQELNMGYGPRCFRNSLLFTTRAFYIPLLCETC